MKNLDDDINSKFNDVCKLKKYLDIYEKEDSEEAEALKKVLKKNIKSLEQKILKDAFLSKNNIYNEEELPSNFSELGDEEKQALLDKFPTYINICKDVFIFQEAETDYPNMINHLGEIVYNKKVCKLNKDNILFNLYKHERFEKIESYLEEQPYNKEKILENLVKLHLFRSFNYQYHYGNAQMIIPFLTIEKIKYLEKHALLEKVDSSIFSKILEICESSIHYTAKNGILKSKPIVESFPQNILIYMIERNDLLKNIEYKGTRFKNEYNSLISYLNLEKDLVIKDPLYKINKI